MPEHWWEKPFRVFQTNIREIDAVMDVPKTVADILDFSANTWLLNTGGIVSFYPSKLSHQHPSPWLARRPGGDLIGDAVREAHAHGVRFLARMDFSKLHRDQLENHPDWFYVSPKGERQVFNGTYATCPSGPYYQEKSFEAIAEVLDSYPVDGFFFNMFRYTVTDYAGVYHGICQCVHCQRRFQEFCEMDLPAEEDWSNPAYLLKWLEFCRRNLGELAGRIRQSIKARNPEVCLLLRHNPDVIMHEVNNAVDRPLPLWPYWAGEAAREARTAYPDRPMVINAVMFLDIPYRFVAEQPGLIGLHMSQNMSQGVNLWSYVLGTTDQPDRKNYAMVKRMLTFHKEHEAYYAGLRSAARVAIISSLRSEELCGREDGPARVQRERRGLFRALLESHIPFDILPDEHLPAAEKDGRLARYRALLLPNAAALRDEECAVLDRFVQAGGGLVATYETAAYDAEGRPRMELGLRCLGASRVIAHRQAPGEMRAAYLRVNRREDLPGFDLTELVHLDRAFLHVERRPGAVPSLLMIPPAPYGPPEKCYWEIETREPGLVWHQYGKGQTAYFTWPIGALFFDHSLPEHRGLVAEAVRRVAGGSQVETDAPPMVEVTVGQQEGQERLLVHLINYSGHSDRSYHEPLTIRNITMSVEAPKAFGAARGLVSGAGLPLTPVGGRAQVTLPELGLFEVIVLE
ncbi:MAG: beta-galactosidase trimerization domain-containing protein [Bacteroidetes bacterium]|nr:beta-galactosidase trimerization domain-containing protein [Bacteroidota bacterium]